MYYGLLNQDFVNQLKNSSTYDDASFSREFGSKWSHTTEGSLFDFSKLQGLRKLKKPEWEARHEDNVFYVASVDVARSSARTVIEVFKVRMGEDHFTKNLVNIILMEGRNFLYQATKIKELDQEFGFDWVTIDGNGLTY